MKLLKFESLTSIDTALLHLQCSHDLVRSILTEPTLHYEQIDIPRRRKSGRPRIVYKLSNDLRRIQRTLALALRPRVSEMPDCVQGFRKKHCIVTNAKKHCNKYRVVTADISDFFGTIPFEAVLRVFQAEVPCQQVALMLARLCTRYGRLPQGGRTSPSIANLVTGLMDDDIESRWPDCEYSRYGDDLTLSGAVVPSKHALDELLSRHGHSLKAGSFHTQTPEGGQYVTGLVVSGKQPRMPRRVRRGIERDLRFSERFRIGGHLKNRGESDDDKSVAHFRLCLKSRIHSWGRAEKVQRDDWLARFSRLVD